MDIIAEEEHFLIITDEDLEVSMEENKTNRYGKILADKEINIRNVRRCLRRAWRDKIFESVRSVQACTNSFF